MTTIRVEITSSNDVMIDTPIRLFNLESDKFNKFEGVITGTYTTTGVYFKAYFKILSYGDMLINPIFDRLETTITSQIADNDVNLSLSKFTANGTDFIGFIGICFNHVAIYVFNGDSDLITQFDYSNCSEESITFISNDRNYSGSTSIVGNKYFSFPFTSGSSWNP